MTSFLKSAVLVLLLLAVAAVFIAPSVDLEPTALRASQAAKAVQMAIILAALVFTALLSFVGYCVRHTLEPGPSIDCDLLVLNCTRLC